MNIFHRALATVFPALASPGDQLATIDGVQFRISYSAGDDGGEWGCVDMLAIPTVSAAVNVKANDVSQIPIYQYMRTSGGRQRVKSPLDYALSVKPNPYQNAATFWRTVAMQATVGECFVSTRGGQLTLLPFGYAVRFTGEDGATRYATIYTPDEAQAMKLPPDKPVIKEIYEFWEVWHFWTFQDENGCPVPMRCRFRHVLGLASDLYRYTSKLYNRGGAIVGYLSTDSSVDDRNKKLVADGFRNMLKKGRWRNSASNVGVAALDQGWKFNALNLSPQEMMLLETKKDLKKDFAQIVGVPLWKVGELEDYKYATAEAAQREYLLSSLNPLLNQIESEINAKSFLDFEPFYVEFSRDALISIDAEAMARIDDIGIKNGCMSVGEWRSRRNLPVGGPDLRQFPVNVTSAEYAAANEAIKLEAAKVDLEIKRQQLAAGGKPPGIITLPAAAPPAAPPPAAEDPAIDMAASLRAIQAKYAAGLTAETLKDAEALATLARSVIGEVATLYDLADRVGNFPEKYTSAATKRIAEAAAVDPAYEINRMVNAANFEAMKLAHGVKVKVRWVGGTNDGQIRTLGEPWTGTLRHPPIIDGEHESFLVLEK
jgi:HK97 family phage portal protein